MSRPLRRACDAPARWPPPAAAPRPQRGLALLALALLAAGLAALPAAPAQAVELKIEAPRFRLDAASNTYTYEDGRLTLGVLTLFASDLQLNATTGDLRASGYVRLESPDISGIAASLRMDVNTRMGTLHNADLYLVQSGLYVRAATVILHPDGSLELRKCTLTSCKPDVEVPWSLVASSVTMRSDDIGVAWNPRFWVGSVPLLWLPGVAWPTVTERRSGVLTPRLYQETSSLQRYNNGLRLQVPVFVNLGYDHDLTMTPEVIQNRGLPLGLEYNYAFWEQQLGHLLFWGIKERKARDPAQEYDVLTPAGGTPPAGPLTRYRLDWLHNQRLGESARLIVNLHHTSDGQLRHEYDNVLEYRPYRTYHASLTAQGPWAQGAVTFEQNADFIQESVYARQAEQTDLRLRPQLLPRLSGRVGGPLLPTLPLSWELGVTATRFEAPDALSGMLYTATPLLQVPIALGGAFELRPRLAERYVSYSGLQQGSPSAATQALPDSGYTQRESSLELRTALARVYRPAEGRFTALKHRIVPRLIFTEVQDVAQPYADQVLWGSVAQKLITLRLETELLAHQRSQPAPAPARPGLPGVAPPDAPTTQLISASLTQRYDLLQAPDAPARVGPQVATPQETDPGQPLLPLVLELRAVGAQFDANLRLNYHHQRHRATETAFSINGYTRPGTSLSIAYASNDFTYYTPENQKVSAGSVFNFGGAAALTDRWALGFTGRVNLVSGTPPLDRRLDQGTLYVDYRPNCYAARVSYAEQVTAAPQASGQQFYVDRRFTFSIELSGLVGGLLRPPVAVGALPAGGGTLPYTAGADVLPPATCHG